MSEGDTITSVLLAVGAMAVSLSSMLVIRTTKGKMTQLESKKDDKTSPAKDSDNSVSDTKPVNLKPLVLPAGKPVNFESDGGILKANGKRAFIKGANWSGFETKDFGLHPMWSHSFADLLKFLKTNSFNALRVPVSIELCSMLGSNKPAKYPVDWLPRNKGVLTSQTSPRAFLDLLVSESAKAGILIMFDIHRGAASAQNSDIWTDPKQSSTAASATAIKSLLAAYGKAWNVFAIDLKNEPQAGWTWGGGGPKDWHAQATALGNVVVQAVPRMLVFVEGVDRHGSEGGFWGSITSPAAKLPVVLKVPKRVVLSPHIYGPDVASQTWFNSPSFPKNCRAIWTRQSLPKAGPATILGEWGGKFVPGSKDEKMQNELADWMIKSGVSGNFYWCLNHNSGDTGGLIKTSAGTPSPETAKLKAIARAVPAPTRFA